MRQRTAWVVVLAWLLAPGLLAQEPQTVQGRLAAAKIAEARGEFANAEKQLRDALAMAALSQRGEVEAALRSLLQRLGRPQEGATVAATVDPVQRLIETLDTGGIEDAAVKAARDSLASLGGLAIPQLLSAMPKLGPFGLGHVLNLLGSHADPRIAEAVAELVRKADPAVALVVADRIAEFRTEVAGPLARRLFLPESGNPVPVRAEAWFALCKHGAATSTDVAGALPLLENGDPEASGNVIAGLALVRDEWATAALHGLAERALIPQVRSRLIAAVAGRVQSAEEMMIVQQLEALPADYRLQPAFSLAREHPQWPLVAAVALRTNPEPGMVAALVMLTEWWRKPEASAELLLQVLDLPLAEGKRRSSPRTMNPETSVPRACVDALRSLVERGWVLPPERDGLVLQAIQRAQYAGSAFVSFLPFDGEERALAAFTNGGETFGVELAQGALSPARPWFRLTVRAMAAVASNPHGSQGKYGDLLVRDWNGAPAEVVAELVAVTSVAVRNGNSSQGAAARAMSTCPTLPVDLLFPYLATREGLEAIQLAEERDPKALLGWLRANPTVADNDNLTTQVASLLLRHGGALDVPLAVHLIRSGAALGEVSSDEIAQFLTANGRGHLEVVRLAEQPIRLVPSDTWVRLATEAASEVASRDFRSAVALCPALEPSCAQALHTRLLRIIRKEDAAALLADLRGMPPVALLDDSGTTSALSRKITLLAAAGGPAAIPLLDELLAAMPPTEPDSAADRLAGLIARTRIELSPQPRADVIRSMLTSGRVVEVLAAMRSPEAWQPELLDTLVAAAVRVATQRAIIDSFAEIAASAWLPFCRAVLAHRDLAQCKPEFVVHVLRGLGDARDPAAIPLLASALAHGRTAVRLEVARQLGRTLSPDAASALITLLRDDDPELRKAADDALTAIADHADKLQKWQARFPAKGR
ncbi:MAG: HEAT repeat domain-containing protein [Planctomycetes bacterium]|nr:HEAT repeat domain-containing protein [Planctomycetota bacterium]